MSARNVETKYGYLHWTTTVAAKIKFAAKVLPNRGDGKHSYRALISEGSAFFGR